jgi:hypothetical protein
MYCEWVNCCIFKLCNLVVFHVTYNGLEVVREKNIMIWKFIGYMKMSRHFVRQLN